MQHIRFQPASLVKRIIAYLIDTLPIQMGLYLVSMGVFGISPIVDGLASPSLQIASVKARWLIEIGTLVIWILYCIAAELTPWRGTFGKKAVGIAVQSAAGGRLTTGQVFGRNAGKFLSAIPCHAGFFAAFVTHGNRAWHDMMSSTTVVNRK